jgi:hypothetical protein
MRTIYNSSLKQHWTKKGTSMKPKRAFQSFDEAMKFINDNNLDFKCNPYKCPVCNMYHVGHHK